MRFGSLSSAPLKNERARLLERDDDHHILLQEGEAGLAPLELLGQIAVECDFAQPIRFLLPLLRVGNFIISAFSWTHPT